MPSDMLPPDRFLDTRSWFSFQGRIARREYWLHYALPLSLIPFAAAIVDSVAQLNGIFSVLVALVLIVPSFSGAVKRAHDRDRSGWFLLVCLIPIVGSIWFVVEIGFLRGTEGPNRFGPDPRRAALPYGMAAP